MPENDDKKASLGLAYNLASNALIAEYNSIRQAALMRDQRANAIDNFIMLVFSAVIVGAPVIISQQHYALLPLLSLLLSALLIESNNQSLILNELDSYEANVLRPKLELLIEQASSPSELPNSLREFWQWQSFHRQNQSKRRRSLLRNVIGKFLRISLGGLSLFASISFPLLFIYYRGLKGLSLPVWILLLISLANSCWSIVGAFSKLARPLQLIPSDQQR